MSKHQSPPPDAASLPYPHDPSMHPHDPSMYPHDPSMYPHDPSMYPHDPSMYPHDPHFFPQEDLSVRPSDPASIPDNISDLPTQARSPRPLLAIQGGASYPEMEETKSLSLPTPPLGAYDEETLGLDPATRSFGRSLGLDDEDASTAYLPNNSSILQARDAALRAAEAAYPPPPQHSLPAIPPPSSPATPLSSPATPLSSPAMPSPRARETRAYGDRESKIEAESPALLPFKDSRSFSQETLHQAQQVGIGGGFRLILLLTLLFLGGAISVLGYLIFNELYGNQSSQKKTTPAAAKVSPETRRADEEAVLERRYQLALEAAQKKRWDIVLRGLSMVIQSTQDTQRKQRSLAIQAFAEREITAQSTLTAAQKATQRKKLDDALLKLQTIPPDVEIAPQAKSLRKRLQKEAFEKPLKQIAKLQKRKRLSPALKRLQKLIAIDPEAPALRRAHRALASATRKEQNKCKRACNKRFRGSRKKSARERCNTRCENKIPLPAALPASSSPPPLSGLSLLGQQLIANPKMDLPTQDAQAPIPTTPTRLPPDRTTTPPDRPTTPQTTTPTPQIASATTTAPTTPSCKQQCARTRGRRKKMRCLKRCRRPCLKACEAPFAEQARSCKQSCRTRRCKKKCTKTLARQRKTCPKRCP